MTKTWGILLLICENADLIQSNAVIVMSLSNMLIERAPYPEFARTKGALRLSQLTVCLEDMLDHRWFLVKLHGALGTVGVVK